jgi:prephenate dehydrogenase
MQTPKKIAIIGTGLIGGSLALRLRDLKMASAIYGVEANPVHAATAVQTGLVDKILPLEEAIRAAEVVVLSIPVDAAVSILPTILDLVQNQIVFDVGSTKFQIVDCVKNHPHRKRFVATHPMWGTEKSGPTAALLDAFKQKAVVVCDQESSGTDALEWVEQLYQSLGMHLLYMSATDHDLHAAYVSHISHITSFALANTVLAKEKERSAIFEMASGGFESTVRLAKSNAAMWVPIFLQNKTRVLDVLDEHIDQLTHFRQQLLANDGKGMEQFIQAANQIARVLK